MLRMLRRLQASLRRIGPQKALAVAMGLVAVLLLALTVAVIWLSISLRQQATEQVARKEAPVPRESQSEKAPLAFGPGPSELTEVSSGGRLQGIPGFQEMNLIGSLQYLPNTNFSCPGGSPDQGFTKRVCTSLSEEDSPASYEVTVVDKGATTLLVEATAYDASEEEAATFLTYVAKLTLKGVDPINPEAWASRNISSGGQYFAEGAELRLYGTNMARTLEIVATGSPTERSSKTSRLATNPQATTT